MIVTHSNSEMANNDQLDDSKTDSARLSGHNRKPADDEEDELRVSRRGDLPPKNAHITTAVIGSGSIEEQLEGLAKEEEKSWNHLDSVHSKSSYGAGSKYKSQGAGFDESGQSWEDSCSSFASFGGSAGGGDDDSESSDHAYEKAQFKNLEPEMTPRRRLLAARKPSSRVLRTPSYRGSNLQLVPEGEDDLS